jgi:hypothetical protein
MNKIFKKISHYSSVFTKRRQDRRNLPGNPLLGDIYLVSFPKSGNTWLRFLVANTLKVHYQIQREVSFFTIEEFVPDVHQTLGMNIGYPGIFGSPEVPRIIKSHSAHNSYYRRAILLVRDPRDVMVSYFYHHKRLETIPESYTLSNFIHHEKYGVKAWKNHTESWFKKTEGQGVQIFRYEDLLNNTQTELDRLMDLLGIKVEESNLLKAITLSSKENMSNNETKLASTFRVRSRKVSFVREGKATGGKELSDLDRQFIEDTTRDLALILRYDY